MKIILFFILFLPFGAFGQDILVLGKKLELKSGLDSIRFHYKDSLAEDDLTRFGTLFIFSTANSGIRPEEEKKIIDFVNNGGKLYLGAENPPFHAESSQLLKSMYNLELYGDFNSDTLEIDSYSNFRTANDKKYSAGHTTVSFPMDYRFRVEAWSKDNPIILSGIFGAGKIIIDGGYSRFYDLENTVGLLDEMLKFLLSD